MSNLIQTSPSPFQISDELETMVLKELLCPDSNGSDDLGHGFHESKQGVQYTISEPARREDFARLLKLNQERNAKEVKQGLHEKKKPKATKGKKEAKANTQAGPSLFHEGEDA